MSDADEFHNLLSSGDTLEAARLMRENVGKGGNSSIALNALLYTPEAGDPKGSIPEARAKHLKLLVDAPEPLRVVLLYNLGCIALYNDDILAAKLRFGEAARLSPKHHPSLHNLAHAHEMMADFEEARIEIGRALNVSPGCVLTQINLAAVCFASGDIEQGLDTLRELAAAHPDNMGAALHICRGLLEYGGQDEAREALNVLEQRPGGGQHPELVACRAFACYRSGAWDEAEALFEELLELDPGSAFARMGIIKVLAARENYQGLLLQLEKYQQLHAYPDVGHIIDKIRKN